MSPLAISECNDPLADLLDLRCSAGGFFRWYVQLRTDTNSGYPYGPNPRHRKEVTLGGSHAPTFSMPVSSVMGSAAAQLGCADFTQLVDGGAAANRDVLHTAL